MKPDKEKTFTELAEEILSRRSSSATSDSDHLIDVVDLTYPKSALAGLEVEFPMTEPPKISKRQEEFLRAFHEMLKDRARRGCLKDSWPGQWGHIRKEIEEETNN